MRLTPMGYCRRVVTVFGRNICGAARAAMNRFPACLLTAASLILACVAAAQPAPEAAAPKIFAKTCASCHGTRLQGGQGPSLLGSTYIHGTDDETVAGGIRQGYPDKGMPPWGGTLSANDIQVLVQFIKQRRIENSPEHLTALDKAQIRSIPSGITKTE